ncbi:hypothetical protein [Dictyobacter aurantiacus]|uniref:Uncharacterized protein n=1 Tax=Dictyobacter aurantiacus TaxID=1936993 RepID=A0A401ZB26_9CHLR|nr:hypothetical protein [Dictyobacter aurantiacus]GCE03938.1 hypothetical protein KDAU_12670 [Dictyobacter aurantiacus]
MRKQYLRWIVPVLVLLIMATILVIGPAIMSHAAGVKTVAPTSTATSTPSNTVTPNYWFNW